jgi:hypothetical protein
MACRSAKSADVQQSADAVSPFRSITARKHNDRFQPEADADSAYIAGREFAFNELLGHFLEYFLKR